ncbi:MAG: succinyldiaminopimelate transaminase [Pseudomonadota bacterium]|mgnify:CR=1 FL=1|nr:succinyldiaminopimelate transaminase [Pseudomonadota bacterium]
MNKRLNSLHPYPFERISALVKDVTPPKDMKPISLALGEPTHRTPNFLIETYCDPEMISNGFSTYPPTKGILQLREAIANFVTVRFNLSRPIDAGSEVLPVNGTREALFAIAQAVIDGSGLTFIPNPFYQIYEGAAILAGSRVRYIPCDEANNFNPDFNAVTKAEWEACSLVYLCTPGNPSGSIMSIEDLQYVIRKSDDYKFTIVSDECYSEIYSKEAPPGLLEAASAMGRHDYKNCIAFNSLSKRSNLPGLRSGYVCGDANILEKFLLYRTYHGSAMPIQNQFISALAWEEEKHTIENRSQYLKKYEAFLKIVNPTWPMQQPDAGFYLWPKTPIPDEEFTIQLLAKTNVKIVPGSYLAREVNGVNPGSNRVRLALVAEQGECVEAAHRIKHFLEHLG